MVCFVTLQSSLIGGLCMCPPAHEIIIEIAINKYHTFSPIDCNNHYTHMMRMRTTMTRTISTTTINMTAKTTKSITCQNTFFLYLWYYPHTLSRLEWFISFLYASVVVECTEISIIIDIYLHKHHKLATFNCNMYCYRT